MRHPETPARDVPAHTGLKGKLYGSDRLIDSTPVADPPTGSITIDDILDMYATVMRQGLPDQAIVVLRDGEPCPHPGCLSHISHPCEGCGRIGGRSA